MQFTPQQMRGGGRYANHTRIGNWFEELAVEDSKHSDFQRKASTGNLLLRSHQAKSSQCMQSVPRSYTEDGFCRFGDYVNLCHDLTSVILACDPNDDIFPPWNKFQVSGTRPDQVVARTTFRIVRPPAEFRTSSSSEDDILRYGQPFSIICNESLRFTDGCSFRDPDLYVSSTLKNERNATKASNRQCVFLSASHTSDAVWYCVRPSKGRDPSNERYVAMGHPIAADMPFVLIHHSSNTFLKADKGAKEYTSFGPEAEICTEKSSAPGKLSLVVSEREGLATPQTLTKPDIPGNLWRFVYAASPSEAVDGRTIPDVASFDSLLRELRRQILSGGIFSMVSFRRRIMDTLTGPDVCREVSMIAHREEVRQALLNAGCNYKDVHFDIILGGFDRRGTGHVDIDAILQVLCVLTDEDSKINYETRSSIINKKFDELRGGRKKLFLTDLAALFHPESLPFVQSGDYTPEEATEAFKACFPMPSRKHAEAAIVRPKQFLNFFQDIGASISDDNYFSDVVNSAFY